VTTHIRPSVDHFDTCTDEAIGRRVRWLIHYNGPDWGALPLHEALNGIDHHRRPCSCFKIQLQHVEADLKVHQNAQDARGVDRSREIAALEAKRDALREVMGT
jgi:hypothetical protein